MDGCQAMRVTHELKRIADSLEKLTEYLTTPFRIVGLQTQRDALVWAEDDLEPPVGTVGRNRNGRVTWTRKDDGWHCGRPGCPACPTDWAEVTGWGGPLVEVIEPAPPQDDTTTEAAA